MIDACRRMVSRDSTDQSSQNSGMFPLARSLTRPNFVALRQKVCEIFADENLCSPKKYAKVHPRSPDLSLIDRPYTSFYRQSAATLALDCFVSEISLVFVSQMPLLHIPPRLSPKIWRCSHNSVRSIIDEQRSAVSQIPGLFSCDITFGNINLFNHSACT